MAEPDAPLDGLTALVSPVTARTLLRSALLLSLVLAFWQLDFPLQGSEGRWAMVSREMASSHAPFSMTIGGRPYDDKPFGSYWLIVLASKVTGSMSEFTLRLPSVISYVLTVLLVYAIGRRTVGSSVTAAVAAFIYATMFRILYFSREASADAQTVLGIAVALLLVIEESEKPRWWRWPLFGLVIGLSSLMKGLTGFAVPCFVVFLWCLLVRGFRWLRPVPLLLGVLVFAATVATPFLIAHARQGDWHPVQQLWRESVGRAVSPFDHREPWCFYLWNQFELLLPWSAFLLSAIVLWVARIRTLASQRADVLGANGVRQRVLKIGGFSLWMFDREEDRRQLFPFFCYAAIFLFFTISGSRRTYYLMPVAPFVSVALAQALLEDLPGWARKFNRVMFWVFAVAMLLAGAAALFLGCLHAGKWESYFKTAALHQITPEMWWTIPWWLGPAGLGLIFFALWLALRALRKRPVLAPLMSCMTLSALMMVGVLDSFRTLDQSVPRFGAKVDTYVPKEEGIDLTGTEDKETGAYTGMAEVLYYIHREPASVAKRPTRFRIVYARSLPEILAGGKYRVLCKRIEGLSPEEEQHTKNETLIKRLD